MDLDPTTGTENHTAVGDTDVFVVNVRLDAPGDFDDDGDVDQEDFGHLQVRLLVSQVGPVWEVRLR